jgi:hypothetical protein
LFFYKAFQLIPRETEGLTRKSHKLSSKAAC